MNKILSRISVRIIMVLLVITLLLTGAVYFYWESTVMPSLLRSEYTKADLLANQYAKQLEQRLSARAGMEEVELLFDEMSLLRDPNTKHVLVLSVSLETMDDKVIKRSNEPDRQVEHVITSSTAIFSPLDQMMVGTFALQYNDAFVEKISEQIGARLIMLLMFILGLLSFFALFLEVMLQPLTRIATSLNHMSTGEQAQLPEISRAASWEISYVHHSIAHLLQELGLREKELVEEHERVEQALQQTLDAEKASKAKSRFLANMSHELRTPLNAILGYSEIVMEELDEIGVDNGLQKDLQNIRGSGKHLLGVINDILDISKIEADRLRIHPARVDVVHLLETIVAEIKPMAVANNNKLSLEYPSDCPPMETDDMRLKQIIINMLSNACKFTQNGQVTLLVNCPADTDNILFQVTDTGIGIAQNIQPKVFDAFVQEDNSSTRGYEGTGLGLAISKKLSNVLGGDISFTSKMGEGSVFSLLLPLDYSHGRDSS